MCFQRRRYRRRRRQRQRRGFQPTFLYLSEWWGGQGNLMNFKMILFKMFHLLFLVELEVYLLPSVGGGVRARASWAFSGTTDSRVPSFELNQWVTSCFVSCQLSRTMARMSVADLWQIRSWNEIKVEIRNLHIIIILCFIYVEKLSTKIFSFSSI